MLKKNKGKILLSSIIILLPILFGVVMWQQLPNTLTTHFGVDGQGDGFSSKAFAVFGLPCILLAVHGICLLFTALDKKQQEQNPKALNLIFWIVPTISLLANGIVYRAAFGREIGVSALMPLVFGLAFVFMGNYFPKIKPNRTLGIKITWTLCNEENWSKTHRFAGKVWVAAGVVLLFSAFLPLSAMVWVLLCVTAVAVLLPCLYSFGVYKQHQKDGIVYAAPATSKAEKAAGWASLLVVAVILVGVAVMMFTGRVEVRCGDSSFEVKATYGADITVEYSQIDTVAYRKGFDVGVRTNGFGSARLSTGLFQNDELGSYTLYAYTGATDVVVLTSGEKTLVIGLQTAAETQALYDTLSQSIKK